jgi:hypothetical protein
MSIPNLHCIIYDSHMPMAKKLFSDTIQLLCKLINVNNLLYTYVNVMHQIYISWCGVFTITHAIDIRFGFDLEKSPYVLTQMWTHLWKSINNMYTFPFPKYEFIYINNSSSLVKWSNAEPKFCFYALDQKRSNIK